MLNHTSGLHANPENEFVSESRKSGARGSRKLRLKLFLEALEDKPGKGYLYSNLGYIGAGTIAETLLNTTWEKSKKCEHFFEGKDFASGELKWMGTAADLVFGSNSQLRAIAEVYGCDDAQESFVQDFIAAWDKVMNLDRFDLHK